MIASKISKFVGVDEALIIGVEKSMNFQVDININNALRRGILVKIEFKPIRFKFTFDKLSNICCFYSYGMSSYVNKAVISLMTKF